MDIQLNEAEPEDSIYRYIMDTTCVGGKDSEPVNIPPHWHKVGCTLFRISASAIRRDTMKQGRR